MRGPFLTPITPITGAFLHADPQEMIKILTSLALIVGATAVSGCATATGAAIGAAGGAGVAAATGKDVNKGAVIGGVAGGVIGTVAD